MKKILTITKCDLCPYFCDTDTKYCEHRETCKKMNFKKVPFDLKQYFFPIPEWCPLENYKTDDELLQDINDRSDMPTIVKSDIYLHGFEDGLTYNENEKEK